jgi:hypothetical protein
MPDLLEVPGPVHVKCRAGVGTEHDGAWWCPVCSDCAICKHPLPAGDTDAYCNKLGSCCTLFHGECATKEDAQCPVCRKKPSVKPGYVVPPAAAVSLQVQAPPAAPVLQAQAPPALQVQAPAAAPALPAAVARRVKLPPGYPLSTTLGERVTRRLADVTKFFHAFTTQFPVRFFDLARFKALEFMNPSTLGYTDNKYQYATDLRLLDQHGFNVNNAPIEDVIRGAHEYVRLADRKKLITGQAIVNFYVELKKSPYSSPHLRVFCDFALAIAPLIPTSVKLESHFSIHKAVVAHDRHSTGDRAVAAQCIVKDSTLTVNNIDFTAPAIAAFLKLLPFKSSGEAKVHASMRATIIAKRKLLARPA